MGEKVSRNTQTQPPTVLILVRLSRPLLLPLVPLLRMAFPQVGSTRLGEETDGPFFHTHTNADDFSLSTVLNGYYRLPPALRLYFTRLHTGGCCLASLPSLSPPSLPMWMWKDGVLLHPGQTLPPDSSFVNGIPQRTRPTSRRTSFGPSC